LGGDDQSPPRGARREFLAQLPQKTGNARVHADGLGTAKDEPPVRRSRHNTKRRAAGGDDEAVFIGLDRAGDFPKA
jgi:hypothetical protein